MASSPFDVRSIPGMAAASTLTAFAAYSSSRQVSFLCSLQSATYFLAISLMVIVSPPGAKRTPKTAKVRARRAFSCSRRSCIHILAGGITAAEALAYSAPARVRQCAGGDARDRHGRLPLDRRVVVVRRVLHD